jgi:hypothetical protein
MDAILCTLVGLFWLWQAGVPVIKVEGKERKVQGNKDRYWSKDAFMDVYNQCLKGSDE